MLQIRNGLPLSPVGSVRDNLLSRVLINERILDNLKVSFHFGVQKDSMKGEQLVDTFEELYMRNMYREHQYLFKKALKVLDLEKTLEEAKQIITPKGGNK